MSDVVWEFWGGGGRGGEEWISGRTKQRGSYKDRGNSVSTPNKSACTQNQRGGKIINVLVWYVSLNKKNNAFPRVSAISGAFGKSIKSQT